jgi:hypothetical protein
MSASIAVATTLLAGGENKKSGPIGLAVILLLCVACYFLFKSMSRHLRKVREEFPADAPPQGGELAPPPAAKPTDTGETPADQPAESAPPGDGPA